jgi:hypothetical protein
LLAYRLAITAFCWVFFVGDAILEGKVWRFWNYWTGWGFFFASMFFTLASIHGVFVTNRSRSFQGFYAKFTHILFEVAFCAQLSVCLGFWFILVPGSLLKNMPSGRKDLWFVIFNIISHLAFWVFLVIDNYFNDIRFYRKHLLVTYAVGALYYVWHNIVVAITGNEIYKGFHPLSAGGLISTVILLLIVFAGYKIGDWMYGKKEILLSEENCKQISSELAAGLVPETV